MPTAPSKFRELSDEDWTALLVKSIHQPVIDGVAFPRFPADQLQSKFVGSANEVAVREAAKFYSYVKDNARALGNPLSDDSMLLDFGCAGVAMRKRGSEPPPLQKLGDDDDPWLTSTGDSALGLVGKSGTVRPRLRCGEQDADR